MTQKTTFCIPLQAYPGLRYVYVHVHVHVHVFVSGGRRCRLPVQTRSANVNDQRAWAANGRTHRKGQGCSDDDATAAPAHGNVQDAKEAAGSAPAEIGRAHV